MAFHPGRTRLLTFSSLLALSLFLGCSDEGTGIEAGLGPLLGVWEAQVLELPSPENPLETLDIIQEGGSYVLSVIGSGQYTAVFDLVLLQGFEAGTVQVSGQTIILTPAGSEGGEMSGSWMLEGDILIIDALRALDIDLDGTDEVIPLYVEFSLRQE